MARPKTGRNGSPTNVYLNREIKLKAQKEAKARYGFSLSELVEKLLEKEMSLKKGLIKGAK